MARTTFFSKVKYERELKRDLAAEVVATPGGEKIFSCLQCGTCGSACPVSTYMDYTPRRLIGMVREGFKQEVVESFAIWLCASCYECTVRCPAGIKVTDVMYALKRIAIREGIYPRRFLMQAKGLIERRGTQHLIGVAPGLAEEVLGPQKLLVPLRCEVGEKGRAARQAAAA